MLPDPQVPPSIAELLLQSRASHLRKKHAAGKTNKDGIVTSQPNYVTAESHIKDALLARLDAEARDPDHRDPAWAIDQAEAKAVSATLISFYVNYLSTDRYSSAWDEATRAMTPEQQARLDQLAGVAHG